jgi:hypothetical protein
MDALCAADRERTTTAMLRGCSVLQEAHLRRALVPPAGATMATLAASVDEMIRNPDVLTGEAEDMLGLLESKGPMLDLVRKEYEHMYEQLQASIDSAINTERKVEEIFADITWTKEQVSTHCFRKQLTVWPNSWHLSYCRSCVA